MGAVRPGTALPRSGRNGIVGDTRITNDNYGNATMKRRHALRRLLFVRSLVLTPLRAPSHAHHVYEVTHLRRRVLCSHPLQQQRGKANT